MLKSLLLKLMINFLEVESAGNMLMQVCGGRLRLEAELILIQARRLTPCAYVASVYPNLTRSLGVIVGRIRRSGLYIQVRSMSQVAIIPYSKELKEYHKRVFSLRNSLLSLIEYNIYMLLFTPGKLPIKLSTNPPYSFRPPKAQAKK
jgi:hypothetical protein